MREVATTAPGAATVLKEREPSHVLLEPIEIQGAMVTVWMLQRGPRRRQELPRTEATAQLASGLWQEL